MQIGKVAADEKCGGPSSKHRKSVDRLCNLKLANDIVANTAERNLLRIAYGETYYYLENRKSIDNDIAFLLDQAQPLEKQLFIHSSLMTSDKLALKVVSGQKQGGKEISIAIFRLKKLESEVHKTNKLLGLKPDATHWQQPECVARARARAAKALGRMNDSESIRTLKAIEKWGSLNRDTSELMLLMLCEGDAGKKAQADSCIRNISRLFKKLHGIGEKNGNCGMVSAASLPNAALNWPIDTKKAHEIYRKADRRTRLFLDRWGHDYLTACKARAAGAKVGEANAAMQIDAMLTEMEMAMKKYGKSKRGIKAMNAAADCLYSAYKGTPRWNCSSLAETNFQTAIANGAVRMMQIEAFKKLDACTRRPDFNPAMGKALRLMAANYMANYCAVWGKETELWSQLISNFHTRALLQQNGNGRIGENVASFIADARKEKDRLKQLDDGARKSERNEAFHSERKEVNLKIEAEIASLAKISPEIAEAIENARKKNFGHVNYKQGEKLCKDIRTAYLQPIQLAKALRGKIPGEDVETIIGRHFEANMMMFRMVSKSKKVAAAIMDDISPLLHIQTKGFDMESPLKKLVKTGFTGGQSVGKITFLENAKKVRVTFKDHSTQFDYLAAAAADDRVSPMVTGNKDHPDINLYGKKLAFSDLFPGEQEAKAPDEIYSRFFRLAGKDKEKYDSIRQKIAEADMASAHYLSTYIDKTHNSGVVLMDGDKFAKNLPLKLSTKRENTFVKYLMEEYPAFEADLAEVNEYVRQKIAIRVVDRLHSRLPSYMRMYAESLAAEASKPALP